MRTLVRLNAFFAFERWSPLKKDDDGPKGEQYELRVILVPQPINQRFAGSESVSTIVLTQELRYCPLITHIIMSTRLRPLILRPLILCGVGVGVYDTFDVKIALLPANHPYYNVRTTQTPDTRRSGAEENNHASQLRGLAIYVGIELESTPGKGFPA